MNKSISILFYFMEYCGVNVAECELVKLWQVKVRVYSSKHSSVKADYLWETKHSICNHFDAHVATLL